MNDYIKEARRIVTGYFAALAPSEQLRRETAQELRQGHITEGYARELTLSANSEALKLRQNAQGQLDALARRFASSATAADTPDGNALQGGDYRLLAENFPMSVEEFSALCERNKNNPTLLRKAMEYGDKHGGMAPYTLSLPFLSPFVQRLLCASVARPLPYSSIFSTSGGKASAGLFGALLASRSMRWATAPTM